MPEPILVAIAAALAGKGVGSLYDVVRKKFLGRARGMAALDAAKGAAPDSPEVRALSEELASAEQSDPQFSADLRAVWGRVSVEQQAASGGVVNQVSGTVSGKVVQARDIEGGVTF